MAESVVSIMNLALARVGVKKFLSSETEARSEADVCSLFYPETRDRTLAAMPWPFATKRSTLSLLTDEASRDGWTYVYALPNDCIQPRSIYPGTRNPSSKQRIPFAIEVDGAGTGQVLVTDEQTPVLIYTMRFENPVAMHPDFTDALAWLLAAEIAMPLNLKPDLENLCRQRWQMTLARAMSTVGSQGQADTEPDSEFITARS